MDLRHVINGIFYGNLAFPSFYPRRGTSVGHRVVLVECNDSNAQQRFGWSGDEARLVGVNGYILFSDFWGDLRHRMGGTNKPQPGDPPLSDTFGEDRPDASEMRERVAGEHIVLDVVGLPPTARCKSLTVPTDPGQCSASAPSAAIDNGSSSSDGNPITLSQSPAGPYPVGATAVTLIVADGPLSASCVATVTVIDRQAPSITCPATPAAAECTGNRSAVVAFPDATIGADNCGLTQSDGCLPATGSRFSRGSTTVTCSAHDGATPPNTNSCHFPVLVVDTTPPSITCPPAATLECTSHHSASFSPVPANASDICGGVTISTPVAASFPLGTSTLTYTATDEVNLSTSCTTSVTVADTSPPTLITLAATPQTLWPPNHTMVETTVHAQATDVCDAAPVCRLTAISSNEPQGNKAPDWQITGPLTVKLRAERDGNGGDRVYTLTVTCVDDSGNSTTGVTTVTVLHDQGKKK